MSAEKPVGVKAELSPFGGLKMTIRREKPLNETPVVEPSEWVTQARGEGVGKLVIKKKSTGSPAHVSPRPAKEGKSVGKKSSPHEPRTVIKLCLSTNADDGGKQNGVKNWCAYEMHAVANDEMVELSPACHLQPSPKDSGIDISSPPHDDGPSSIDTHLTSPVTPVAQCQEDAAVPAENTTVVPSLPADVSCSAAPAPPVAEDKPSSDSAIVMLCGADKSLPTSKQHRRSTSCARRRRLERKNTDANCPKIRKSSSAKPEVTLDAGMSQRLMPVDDWRSKVDESPTYNISNSRNGHVELPAATPSLPGVKTTIKLLPNSTYVAIPCASKFRRKSLTKAERTIETPQSSDKSPESLKLKVPLKLSVPKKPIHVDKKKSRSASKPVFPPEIPRYIAVHRKARQLNSHNLSKLGASLHQSDSSNTPVVQTEDGEGENTVPKESMQGNNNNGVVYQADSKSTSDQISCECLQSPNAILAATAPASSGKRKTRSSLPKDQPDGLSPPKKVKLTVEDTPAKNSCRKSQRLSRLSETVHSEVNPGSDGQQHSSKTVTSVTDAVDKSPSFKRKSSPNDVKCETSPHNVAAPPQVISCIKNGHITLRLKTSPGCATSITVACSDDKSTPSTLPSPPLPAAQSCSRSPRPVSILPSSPTNSLGYEPSRTLSPLVIPVSTSACTAASSTVLVSTPVTATSLMDMSVSVTVSSDCQSTHQIPLSPSSESVAVVPPHRSPTMKLRATTTPSLTSSSAIPSISISEPHKQKHSKVHPVVHHPTTISNAAGNSPSANVVPDVSNPPCSHSSSPEMFNIALLPRISPCSAKRPLNSRSPRTQNAKKSLDSKPCLDVPVLAVQENCIRQSRSPKVKSSPSNVSKLSSFTVSEPASVVSSHTGIVSTPNVSSSLSTISASVLASTAVTLPRDFCDTESSKSTASQSNSRSLDGLTSPSCHTKSTVKTDAKKILIVENLPIQLNIHQSKLLGASQDTGETTSLDVIGRVEETSKATGWDSAAIMGSLPVPMRTSPSILHSPTRKCPRFDSPSPAKSPPLVRSLPNTIMCHETSPSQQHTDKQVEFKSTLDEVISGAIHPSGHGNNLIKTSTAGPGVVVTVGSVRSSLPSPGAVTPSKSKRKTPPKHLSSISFAVDSPGHNELVFASASASPSVVITSGVTSVQSSLQSSNVEASCATVSLVQTTLSVTTTTSAPTTPTTPTTPTCISPKTGGSSGKLNRIIAALHSKTPAAVVDKHDSVSTDILQTPAMTSSVSANDSTSDLICDSLPVCGTQDTITSDTLSMPSLSAVSTAVSDVISTAVVTASSRSCLVSDLCRTFTICKDTSATTVLMSPTATPICSEKEPENRITSPVLEHSSIDEWHAAVDHSQVTVSTAVVTPAIPASSHVAGISESSSKQHIITGSHVDDPISADSICPSMPVTAWDSPVATSVGLASSTTSHVALHAVVPADDGESVTDGIHTYIPQKSAVDTKLLTVAVTHPNGHLHEHFSKTSHNIKTEPLDVDLPSYQGEYSTLDNFPSSSPHLSANSKLSPAESVASATSLMSTGFCSEFEKFLLGVGKQTKKIGQKKSSDTSSVCSSHAKSNILPVTCLQQASEKLENLQPKRSAHKIGPRGMIASERRQTSSSERQRPPSVGSSRSEKCNRTRRGRSVDSSSSRRHEERSTVDVKRQTASRSRKQNNTCSVDVEAFAAGHRQLAGLRNRVCRLIETVFDELQLPASFARDSPSVDQLVDRLSDVLSDAGPSAAAAQKCSDLSVTLCHSPSSCLRRLQQKVIQLLMLMLPDLELTSSDADSVDVILDLVTSANQTDIDPKSSQTRRMSTSSLVTLVPIHSLVPTDSNDILPVFPLSDSGSGNALDIATGSELLATHKRSIRKQVKNCLMFLDMDLT